MTWIGGKTIFRMAAVLAIALLSLGGGGAGTQGAYKLHFKGDLTGDGNAAVSAKKVNIVAQVTDAAGSSGQLHVQAVLDQNRFVATGTVLGQAITLSGRIDPADNTLPHARLVCTFTLASGGGGRFIGVGK